jgi:hypothetical protein
MKDVMLDFETFGNGKNAAVCQVGAVYFDRRTGETGASLKINIDAESAEESGAALDASTVYWWLSQSPEAIASVIAEPRIPIRDAFQTLDSFLSNADGIWSHATFDFVILQETVKRLGMKPTFKYKAARDIRTLVDLAGINTKSPEFVRDGVHHDALADCYFQIKYCVAALQALTGGKAGA